MTAKRLKARHLLGLILCAAAAIVGGCRNADSPVGESSPRRSGGADAANVQVRLASWSEVEQHIATQQGKVVVLDVWSTWCSPCVQEFPGLVKLHNEHGEVERGEQVACLSLNCNYTGADGESPEDPVDKIKDFLVQQRASFENFVSTTPDTELFTALDAAAVPIVRVYDKTGALRKQFDNDEGGEEFTYERDIAPLVRELLSE